MAYFLTQSQFDELTEAFDAAREGTASYNEIYRLISRFLETPGAKGSSAEGNVAAWFWAANQVNQG